jgi:hypothetical protein
MASRDADVESFARRLGLAAAYLRFPKIHPFQKPLSASTEAQPVPEALNESFGVNHINL